MNARQLTLANGLRCHLYHQPDTREAAALVRVQAGSLDEADRWPGLAHLLEHLLFCGSESFNGEDRLMPWLQQQGGQVNATTQLSRSAYFFQLPASALSAGVQRLCDMLASPLLTTQAIQQEAAVIEAEFQLLQNHADTLSEAAILDKLKGRFQRFRVGSRLAFSDNVTELQSALRDFHRRYYRAENMELWLQGPQSLDELTQLATRYGASLLADGERAAAVIPTLLPGDRLLQSRGEENFWLTLLIAGDEQTVRDNVTLLKMFWQDEAPGSLLAQLRAEALCEALDVQWLWQDEQHAFLALRFSATRISSEQAQQIEQRVWQHLAALIECNAIQLQHYAQLAQQDFAALSPLEQLRGRALGFAPDLAVSDNFTDFAAALPHWPRTRLLTQRQIDGAPHQTQGFTLQLAEWLPALPDATESAAFHFYPASAEIQFPRLPPVAQQLPLIAPVKQVETLLLRPAFYQTLSDEEAQARQRQLRPLLAELRHAGGNGSWQQTQGSWQLLLNLPASEERALLSVHQALQALNKPVLAQSAATTHSIVIRQLLAALPTCLIKPSPSPQWLAAWCGTHSALSQRVAHLLSDFAPDLARYTPPAQLQRGIVPIDCDGPDQALLLFMPLPHADDASLAVLRVLALMLETRFFQRLRVDQQIGYVVSARYQRVADVDGLMLALQSPDITWRALLGHCKRFMREMVEEIASISPEKLPAWQASLMTQCASKDNGEAALETLRQQHGLATLNRAAIQSLTLPQLQQLHQRLLRERHRWLILVTRCA
ncbi:coenzyme PQQ biosynthesis probable peptidase PqqF [Candidatus Pantoea symbiotica]|jgi:coenzyme PQQ biosynthesis probable peptidase PqqF|uniref:Coenzyme PQQ synthesis protein F n=1 Tax=Candidatus Pantoea symbiotica TaxID=1884370 RepID=A0A1I3QCE6_9GAMM|nr:MULTISPECIES: pyrroloquinoline quinone biosynthesis protein PqqF [Pantoea]KAJ9433214.1 pyrroloquinoline quinone biosynthesis protein PqqF [Pantoea sp. YR343]MRT26555.1 pyrroloquinoline quinone biosynthesis protein PqqF [Enterobacteriaceae bacterium RIT697]SFJ31964.1 coenzyme PQQ biosynthesis probable peptidase PqqF [Pantoea symbiotica]SFU31064.1 coenzyme PQQ biosynthesis probable peptidase PqqF [Pantoea sp. YR525]